MAGPSWARTGSRDQGGGSEAVVKSTVERFSDAEIGFQDRPGPRDSPVFMHGSGSRVGPTASPVQDRSWTKWRTPKKPTLAPQNRNAMNNLSILNTHEFRL